VIDGVEITKQRGGTSDPTPQKASVIPGTSKGATCDHVEAHDEDETEETAEEDFLYAR
jgi:hypothetical protein